MTLTVLRRPAPVAGSADLEGVLATASLLRQESTEQPVLLLSRTRPTAAFSRRDLLLPGYPAAAEAAQALGFEPVVRPVGGHLAAYDEGSLVVHLWSPDPDPRTGLKDRFRVVADALTRAMTDLGVPDVRVGAVPGEYCDGEWSVNTGGTAKLAGTGQRLFRRGWLFCVVLTVTGADRLVDVLTPTYATLGLPFDPASVGSVDRWVPGVTVEQVREVVGARLVEATRPVPAQVSGSSSAASLGSVRFSGLMPLLSE
ncbi:lipoyl protein ligase domain-containing protein [Nocardioides marmoribigeumensis]|jgi:lipoate-protein ligase A|uniref:Lipoate-protein ligase A n=1 Tax=Nocardioides marmoribigeumensis TaxID=433649 RepID=A0ABU2BT59_9ACTN|nr:lipoate--protein ligase family protein [Nocardioides marmoribigeumensis]MDR7361812.1 lipoate-protein ligase A [Nocardioides marmoribigeumensis]